MPSRAVPGARRSLVAAGLLAFAGLAGVSPAADPPTGTPFIARTLLDHSLSARAVLVHRIDGAMITYTDSRGLLRREPTSEFLALLPGDGPTGWQRRTRADTLALVDGQRFPGEALPVVDGDEPPISWDAGFARLTFPLEVVSSLARGGRASPPPDATGDDAVRLVNGDTLRGFVLALGQDVSIETATGVVRVPLERIISARLANPRVDARGTVVWLADGTVACVELLPQGAPDAIEARLVPPGDTEPSLSEGDAPRLSILLASVRALAFEPARLAPLGTLPVVSTASDRPWTPEPELSDAAEEPLGAPDVTLPAPMSVTWLLPADAMRLAFEATLPERCRLWGDAELIVSLEQDGVRAVVGRARLRGETPSAAMNLSLPAPADPRRHRHLTVEVVAGPSGPAQDTIVLERPLLLLGAP